MKKIIGVQVVTFIGIILSLIIGSAFARGPQAAVTPFSFITVAIIGLPILVEKMSGFTAAMILTAAGTFMGAAGFLAVTTNVGVDMNATVLITVCGAAMMCLTLGALISSDKGGFIFWRVSITFIANLILAWLTLYFFPLGLQGIMTTILIAIISLALNGSAIAYLLWCEHKNIPSWFEKTQDKKKGVGVLRSA